MITYVEALIQKHLIQKKSTISTKRWKTSFPKEIVEKTDLHKPVLDKTEEQCVKYEKDEITN